MRGSGTGRVRVRRGGDGGEWIGGVDGMERAG